MDDLKFYNQPLWVSNDVYRTTNQLHFSISAGKDSYAFRPATFHFRITNFKNKVNNNITFQYSHIINLINQIKKMESPKFKAEKLPGIVINKKQFLIFFTTTKEYNETIQIIISTRGEDYLDSEKFYMSFHDFGALCDIIFKSHENYINISCHLQTMSYLNEIQKGSEKINEQLIDIKRISIANNSYDENLSIDEQIEQKNDMDTEIDINDQNELDSYINDNIVDIKIEMQTQPYEEKKKINDKKSLDVMNDNFTEKVLNNNILNFEMICKSCLSSKIPLDQFLEILKDKLQIEQFFPGISKNEKNAMLYIHTIYLKEIIRQHIKEKKNLPNSVYPIRCDIEISNDENMSLMYTLYSYILYYSLLTQQLKEKTTNSFENREFYTFIFKVLTSPFVYSFFKQINKETFIMNITNRIEIQQQRGVFNLLIKNVEESFGYKPLIDMKSITEAASKTYDTIIDKWDCISVSSFMSKMKENNISLLDIDKFNLCSFENIEQIEKFIMLEFNYKMNNNVINMDKLSDDIKDTSDLNDVVLNIFNLGKTFYDNSNLIRYCSDFLEDDENSKLIKNIIDNIKNNVSDVDYQSIDWNIFPCDILKAIITWKPKEDNKIVSNYQYFKDKIEKITLKRDICISMLKNFSQPEKVLDYDNALTLKSITEQN